MIIIIIKIIKYLMSGFNSKLKYKKLAQKKKKLTVQKNFKLTAIYEKGLYCTCMYKYCPLFDYRC